MATITTGDWQRIGYWTIATLSYSTVYASLNAKIVSISNRVATVATLLNIDNVGNGSYSASSVKAGLTGGSDISWGYHTFASNSNTTLIQGSFTVGYDDNGNASTNISAWITQTHGGNLNFSTVSCSLQNIGSKEKTYTAATPSINTYPNNSPNVTAGQTYYIHTNNTDADERFTVRYAFGNASGTIGTNVQYNIQWTIPTSLCQYFTNSTSGTGSIYLDTYVGSKLIGTKSCSMIVSPPSYSVSVSINSITENNSNVSAITTNETIQSLSSKVVTVIAQSQYYASISEVKCNGITLSSIGNNKFQGTLSNMQTGTYSVSVKDSRGYANSTSSSQTFYYYSVPSVTGSASRTDQTSANGSLTVNGTYSQIKSNTVTLSIKRADSTTTDSSTYTGGSTFSKSISYTDLTYTNEFSWTVTAKDKFGQTGSATINLGMGQYSLWLGKTAVKTSGDLTVGGSEVVGGNITSNGVLNVPNKINFTNTSDYIHTYSGWAFPHSNKVIMAENAIHTDGIDCNYLRGCTLLTYNANNAPSSGDWWLIISGGKEGTQTQLAVSLWDYTNPIRKRYCASGTWSSWTALNFSASCLRNVQDAIQVGDVSWTITANNISTSVTASPPSGYNFLCWIQVITDGWCGALYPNTPRDKTCTIYKTTAAVTYNLSGRAYYLYVRGS